MLMMRPCPLRLRWGSASRDIRAKNSSERWIAVAHCSSVASAAWASGGPPELFTRMSSRPNRSTVAATSARIVMGWSRSPANAKTGTPVLSRISCAAFSRSCCERLHSATVAPSAASTCAHARPSPLLAPPTIATLPFSSRSMCGLPLHLQMGVEPVAQRVAHEVDDERGDEDGQAGEGRDPPRVQHVEPALAEHVAPGGRGRLHAEAE